MKDLDPVVRDKIDAIFRTAKQQLKNGDITSALQTGANAWSLLPEPKFEWDVSKSYAHAYASLLRDAEVFDEGIKIMKALFESGTAKPHQDRPHFILGTIHYEMGDMENSRKWLGEANRISKGRCFVDEPEKYKNFVNK